MSSRVRSVLALLPLMILFSGGGPAAQSPLPTLSDPNLTVRAVISGLDQPTSMAFIGANEFLVLEKATGRVKHVINGALAQIVLDLSVNNASERGLLGIALHPQFTANRFVYLYWTCTAVHGPTTFQISAITCPAPPATISGTITAVDVTNLANERGISAGEFDELLKAIRAGATYVTVHSTRWPGGEIRSQINGNSGDEKH